MRVFPSPAGFELVQTFVLLNDDGQTKVVFKLIYLLPHQPLNLLHTLMEI